MSVLKTEVLAFVKESLRKDSLVNADILVALNETLKEISKITTWPDLYRANETGDQDTISEGDETSDFPTDLRVLDYIIINDSLDDGRPLRKITMEKYLKLKEDLTDGDQGEPEVFAERGKTFYWWPIPDANTISGSDTDYTVNFYFWRNHPKTTSDEEDILFGDEFQDVVNKGVVAKIADNKSLPKADSLLAKYAGAIALLTPEEDTNETLAKYHDI